MKKNKIRNWIFSRYLDDGERILTVVHPHVLVFKVKGAKTSFFGVTLPILLYLLFPQAFLVSLIWLTVGLFGMFYHFIDWYFDAWILTNVGVIDLERNGFFDMSSTRIDYHMIEGIAYTVKGFWRTVFNFGDITIDKLGAKTSVVLKDAANPKKVERSVMAYQEKYVSERSIRDHQELKGMLADMIAYHVHNKKITPGNN